MATHRHPSLIHPSAFPEPHPSLSLPSASAIPQPQPFLSLSHPRASSIPEPHPFLSLSHPSASSIHQPQPFLSFSHPSASAFPSFQNFNLHGVSLYNFQVLWDHRYAQWAQESFSYLPLSKNIRHFIYNQMIMRECDIIGLLWNNWHDKGPDFNFNLECSEVNVDVMY